VEAARRRQLIQLGVFGLVLGGLVWFVLLPAVAPVPVAPAGPVRTAGGAAAGKGGGGPVNVKLDALGRAAGEPAPAEGSRRNPFKMGAAPAPVPEGQSAMRQPPKPTGPVEAVPIGPPPVPPPPPIPFRFIGILSGAPGQGRIAVLTDGRIVVHGGVNANIDGRYRIVQIGEESLQIEYADGRGRQTLRLLAQ
jgi:hypothetical protein